ncbi:hypothetical protein [Corynebacterium jeddahense]|uniref:Transmembrane protein n=1 Tax=Corynebacterium jeddahense TaxID=1414719 RepID=A0ABY7UGL4_9CORY|nr:hypothetical protein [Corynebacterium jeddahense]WCZ37866.1 hypothetical protein CJEDD_01195 [Corynebacterium jeddahense]
MPNRWSRAKVSGYVERYLPRLLAVAWAAWAAATAVAYVHLVPKQLEAVDGAIATPVWLLWAVAAVALLLGVLVPSRASDRATDWASWLRIIGMMIVTAELVIWSVAFFVDEPRGWVSGKNYAMLLVNALFSTWMIARERARVKRVVPYGH